MYLGVLMLLFIECIKMCPIVDVKDNVVKLEKVNTKILKKFHNCSD